MLDFAESVVGKKNTVRHQVKNNFPVVAVISQSLRGGASSLRPSGSQTQSHNIYITS